MKAHDTFQNHSNAQVHSIIESNSNAKLRVCLTSGDAFLLTSFSYVDESIYNESGGWMCEVIEPVSGKHPLFNKLYLPGSYVDILEDEIATIKNADTGQTLYQKT